MRIACLALFALLALAGCAGSSSSVGTVSPYAGTYTGTWVNVDKASDQGTSQWTFNSDGTMTGQDFDPTLNLTYNLTGTIQPVGTLQSVSTPTGGSPSSLDGPLKFNSAGQLTGVLIWGVNPPLSYRYTFTKQ